MSIETICDCYARTNDIEKIKIILDNKELQNEYVEEFGELDLTIIEDKDDEVIFRIQGDSCYQYLHSIQPLIYELDLDNVVFMIFSDYDYSYEVEGVLDSKKFKKNIFSSKAKKQFQEIYDSDNPIMTVIAKIKSNKLKVKYT